MDARNDDSSGGSDSLDKSLQRKCVVDDVGQGEGKQAENSVSDAAASDAVQNTESNCRTQHNKTEKTIGDGGGGNGGGGLGSGNVLAVADGALNKRACDELPTIAATNNHVDISSCSSSNTSNNNNNNSNNNNNNNNHAFETKVKQISKDLKETTLAEYNATAETSANNAHTLSASTSSTSSTTSETGNSIAGATSEPCEQSGQLNTSDSADDTRSKKVRFHPDVKENDGGNRVIPKKKKKLKNNNSEDGSTAAGSSQCTQGTDDEMDYEEEEETAEEEEEFNLAKTIAEAQNYLKLHPLTFVRTNNGSNATNAAEGAGKRLHNGLLQEEDLPLLSESSEDEDYYEEITPECGVERILGKQIRNGKTLLLVRFVNDDGLYWESEERISTMCPTMMSKYEINRERRQERLMRHVAKRQNLRQRYTDF